MAETMERACPECGESDLFETTVGHSGENRNLARCPCGWEGTVSETTPPDMLDPGDRPTRVMPAEPSWLKASFPAAGLGAEVDFENRIVRGAVLAAEGCFREPDPRGEFNEKGLRMICEQANARPGGLKMRWGHPDLSADGLGKFVGRAKDCRMGTVTVERDGGKKAKLKCSRGDIHLSDTAFEDNPNGNLGNYILKLAKEDPTAFALSLVIEPEEEYRLEKDGSRKKDAEGNPLPPLWYPRKLHAVDFVDAGAATDGLLSAESWAQALSVGLTPELRKALNFDNAVRLGSQVIDAVFDGQPREVVEARLTAFLSRYLTRRYGAEGNAPSASFPELMAALPEEIVRLCKVPSGWVAEAQAVRPGGTYETGHAGGDTPEAAWQALLACRVGLEEIDRRSEVRVEKLERQERLRKLNKR